MGWWREAKFGMFIHWGVYSVPAGYYHGNPVPGIGEWIMNKGKIPQVEYQAFANEFNPVKFDAEAWVKIAKDAGMKYIVITSKHHDGFAMTQALEGKQVEHLRRDPFPPRPVAGSCRSLPQGEASSSASITRRRRTGTMAAPPWAAHGTRPRRAAWMITLDKIAVPQVREDSDQLRQGHPRRALVGHARRHRTRSAPKNSTTQWRN